MWSAVLNKDILTLKLPDDSGAIATTTFNLKFRAQEPYCALLKKLNSLKIGVVLEIFLCYHFFNQKQSTVSAQERLIQFLKNYNAFCTAGSSQPIPSRNLYHDSNHYHYSIVHLAFCALNDIKVLLSQKENIPALIEFQMNRSDDSLYRSTLKTRHLEKCFDFIKNQIKTFILCHLKVHEQKINHNCLEKSFFSYFFSKAGLKFDLLPYTIDLARKAALSTFYKHKNFFNSILAIALFSQNMKTLQSSTTKEIHEQHKRAAIAQLIRQLEQYSMTSCHFTENNPPLHFSHFNNFETPSHLTQCARLQEKVSNCFQALKRNPDVALFFQNNFNLPRERALDTLQSDILRSIEQHFSPNHSTLSF